MTNAQRLGALLTAMLAACSRDSTAMPDSEDASTDANVPTVVLNGTVSNQISTDQQGTIRIGLFARETFAHAFRCDQAVTASQALNATLPTSWSLPSAPVGKWYLMGTISEASSSNRAYGAEYEVDVDEVGLSYNGTRYASFEIQMQGEVAYDCP